MLIQVWNKYAFLWRMINPKYLMFLLLSPQIQRYIHSEKVAMELFDFGVNAGVSSAVKCIQRALNLIQFPVEIDCRMGPATVQKINDASINYEQSLYMGLIGFEFMHYYSIVHQDPKKLKFIRGWLARL